jgi:MFS family permease
MSYENVDFSNNGISISEWTTKLEKLDDILLFTVSVVGLLFTVFQVLEGGMNGLIEISPILIIGVGLPVYVGFVRGAIEFGNSVTERFRGWVYLAVGITAYLAFFLLRFGILGVLFYSLFILLGLVFGYSLENWFNSCFRTRDNIINLYTFSGTLFAGIFLAYFLSYIVSLYLVYTSSGVFSVFTLLLINLAVITVVIFSVLELTSRRLVVRKLPISEMRAQKRHEAFFLTRVVLCALEIFSLGLRQGVWIIYAFFAGLFFYFGAIIALAVQLTYGNMLAQMVSGVLSVISIALLLTVVILVIKKKELNIDKFVCLPRDKSQFLESSNVDTK